MFILKLIIAIQDIILFLLIMYSKRDLRWENKADRVSICGFWYMGTVIAVSAAVILASL